VTHPGPAFWERAFGIESESEFETVANRYLPSILPFGNLGFNSGIAFTSYQNPFNPAGLTIQAGLLADGYQGSEKSAATSIFSVLQQGLVQNEQGATMSQLVVQNCFQVTIQMIAGGRTVENVIGVSNSGGTALGAAQNVLSAWEQSGGPLSFLSSLVTMVNYHAVDIGSGSGAIADVASTTAGGLSASPLATRAASALVQWNGATRQRSSRGRLYFGPIHAGALNSDGATLSSTYQSNFDGAFTLFLGSLNSHSYPLVVLSRVLSQAFTVNAHAVEATIATQRRRLR
jgi:hypothetical protein